MREVVKTGTAAKAFARVPLEFAGKTGTAYIVLEGKEKIGARGAYEAVDGRRRSQGTFAGFFPAEDPKYSMIVVVYTDLMVGSEGGGGRPARVFKQIVNELWAYDSMWQGELTAKQSMPELTETEIEINDEVPVLKGLGLREAVNVIEQMGYVCEYTGVGHVVKQEKRGETIKITLK